MVKCLNWIFGIGCRKLRYPILVLEMNIPLEF